MISRTAEKVLSIISLVFTVLALVPGFIFVILGKAFSDESVRNEFETEVLPDLESELEVEFGTGEVQEMLSVIDGIGDFGWFIVIVLLISLIATIVGMVSIWNNKNPKLAGIMFIVAGLFAFVLSPTSIMLYIAAILSFTKKPPYNPSESSFVEEHEEHSMRPL